MEILLMVLAATALFMLTCLMYNLCKLFRRFLSEMDASKESSVQDEETEDEFSEIDDYDFDRDGITDEKAASPGETNTSSENAIALFTASQKADCVIGQIESYYGSHGVFDLACFLVQEGAYFNPHKFEAEYLLRWAISYVRYFGDEDERNLKSLFGLLLEADECGYLILKKLMEIAEADGLTPEQESVFSGMKDDLLTSTICYSEESGNIINLAITVLLPYVSGYTLCHKNNSFEWVLTNISKNIMANARQRDWHRRTLAALENIENFLSVRGAR